MNCKICIILIAILFISIISGCSDDDNPVESRKELKNYFPLSSGSSWSYHIIEVESTDTIGTFTEEIYDRNQFNSHWWYEVRGSYDYPGETYDTVAVYFHRLDYDTLYYRDDEDLYGLIAIIPTGSPDYGEELYYEENQDDPSEYRRIIYEEMLDSLVVSNTVFYDVLVESVENHENGEITFRDTHYWAADIGCVLFRVEYPLEDYELVLPLKEYSLE
ncbi:hypothetical protein ACFLQJ_00035 [Calditrichota bacterium]